MMTFIGFAVAIPLSLFNGYALSVIWGWHIVAVFGLPELSVGHGWGIAVMVSLLTMPRNNSQKIEGTAGEQVAVFIVTNILVPAVSMFSAWLALFFV